MVQIITDRMKRLPRKEMYLITMRFFICSHCGNLAILLHDSGVPMFCCGQKMNELKPAAAEASPDRHLPVITVQGNAVTVTVGKEPHPMQPEHSIEWIVLQGEKTLQLRKLTPQDEPKTTFMLAPDDRVVGAWAYCNLHGLWEKK